MKVTPVILGAGAVLAVMVGGNLAATGLRHLPVSANWQVPGGTPEHGRTAILRYGCGGCHTIGGIDEARARVGPRLLGLGEQGFIAGRLPNAPHELVYWIRDPQKIEPGTAMPNLHVTDQDARDIASYLYTQ